jgi:hypothetical protein
MSANDPKRTFAAQDCCPATRPLNPIPPVANPCCNFDKRVETFAVAQSPQWQTDITAGF